MSAPFDTMILVPEATRFPVELRTPPGFRPEDPSTWPRVPGRLEYVRGKLVYMTPCGDLQGDVVQSVAGLLDRWLDDHPELVVSTNEAGMLLGDEVRAADAAVWRRDDVSPHTGGYRRVPPVLAVEVAGRDEDEPVLREKARWYLDHGVAIVWLVFPEERRVLVLDAAGEQAYGLGQQLAADPRLPGLSPEVARFFRQLRP